MGADPELHFYDVKEPRGGSSFAFVDAALGYYDVLGQKTPTESVDADDYDQVDFGSTPGSPASVRLTRGQSPFTSLRLGHLQRRASLPLKAAGVLRNTAHSHFRRIKGHVSARILPTPAHRTLLRDKLAFVLGVSHITISAFWLGNSPSTFYKLYTVKALLLFSIRFYLYRREKMHYYLLDFCYYANLLQILHAWALPEWCGLEKVLFAFSMGPLAWSIVAFRNSLIFHSLDKMTSVFLHAFPPLVAWATRWYPGDPHHWKTTSQRACERKEASVRELILIPWLPYLLWAMFYYLKIFVISSKRIQQRGYHTLFRYVTAKPQSLTGRLYKALPRWAAPVVFMLWHVAFCAVTFCLSWVMWQHYWLNTIFIIVVLGMSAWNGGNYYFEVFAHRYVADVGLPLKHGPAKHGAEPPATRHSMDGVAALDGPAARVALANLRTLSDPTLDTTMGGEENWSDASPDFECASGGEPFLVLQHPLDRVQGAAGADGLEEHAKGE